MCEHIEPTKTNCWRSFRIPPVRSDGVAFRLPPLLGRLFLTFSGESSSSSDGYAKCRGDGQVDVFACQAEGEAFCQEAGGCAFQWECQAAAEEGNR